MKEISNEKIAQMRNHEKIAIEKEIEEVRARRELLQLGKATRCMICSYFNQLQVSQQELEDLRRQFTYIVKSSSASVKSSVH